MLNVGDIVTWTTSSTRKVGRIWAVVQPGSRPEREHDLSRFQIRFAIDYPFPRDHKTYLVEVLGGLRSKRSIYWPVTQQLIVVRSNGAKIDFSRIPRTADRLQVGEEINRWAKLGCEDQLSEADFVRKLELWMKPGWPEALAG
jgi:hypothetical protein